MFHILAYVLRKLKFFWSKEKIPYILNIKFINEKAIPLKGEGENERFHVIILLCFILKTHGWNH